MKYPGSLLVPLLLLFSSTMASVAPQTIAYVGTYTGAKSQGIYAFRVDEAAKDGPTFTPLGLAAATPSPSFLVIDSARRLVFAVNETGTFNGQVTGSVSAFSADPVTGKLTLINQQPSMGTSPCHLTLDPTGRFLLVANYSSGSVAVLPVAADGRLGTPTDTIQYHLANPPGGRQEGPHAHSVVFDPAGRYVFVCDLGADKVYAYSLDVATGRLVPAPAPATLLQPGSGPRHIAFRPDGKFAYVINELACTVQAFDYDAATGRLGVIGKAATVSTLPADFKGHSTCAEVVVDASGCWLYASNRGHDSVAQFALDPASGLPRYLDTQATGGKTPRHFAILPSDKNLVVANQDSGTLRFCHIDGATGRLQPAGETISVGAPVYVGFLLAGKK